MRYKILLAIIFVCFIFLATFVIADSDWSDSWEFTYENQDYDTQSFTIYDSLNFGGKSFVEGNDPPLMSNPNPSNNSFENSVSTATWNITITDPEGDQFNWTIECSNGDANYTEDGTNTNGSKELYFSSLSYYTTYTVWVNATDEAGSGIYTNETFYFTTENSSVLSVYASLNFGGNVTIQSDTIDAETVPNTWNAGVPACGDYAMENFTFYQNGSATINVTIGFNSTNYTYVSWSTYSSNGHNQYTANFTNDSWATEYNIAPGYPVPWTNMLNASVGSNTNFTFGIKIWMPKSVITDIREDFEIVIEENII